MRSLSSRISHLILRISGWKYTGVFPPESKLIIIEAPHTSMWDFVWGWLFARHVGIRPKFLIKSKYFFWPLGPVLVFLGAVPVYPARDTRFYSQMIQQIRQAESFYLIVTPEGTRKATRRWKTGFYKLSLDAGIPVLLTYIDYGNRTIGLGPVIRPEGNIQEDIRRIMSFYKADWAKHPARFSELPQEG